MALSSQWNRQALHRCASPFNNAVYFVCFVRIVRQQASFVCPLRLIAALEIGFGNVPLTDPFDVLFARRIYFPIFDRITHAAQGRVVKFDPNHSSKIGNCAVFICILLGVLLYFRKI